MKNSVFVGLFSVLVTLLGLSCSTTHDEIGDREPAAVSPPVSPTPFEQFNSKLVMAPGQTFLTFMQGKVFPEIQKYDHVIDQVQADAEKTHKFDDIQPTLINAGNGVAIRIDANNYFFNVGYGDGANKNDITGKDEPDQQSGRSYGVGPRGRESDPSDVAYLAELQTYITGIDFRKHVAIGSGKGIMPAFYKAIIPALLNNDGSGWKGLSPLGQEVATDFLAIYTAEQARRLMNPTHRMQWDDALLQVTLLGSFHSGQTVIKPMINGVFTDKSASWRFSAPRPSCAKVSSPKVAGLDDYWTWSRNPDPKNCRRSGINLTRTDFTKTGQIISDFERSHNPALVAKVENHFDPKNRGKNLYNELANHAINFFGLKAFSASESAALTNDFIAFLVQVQKDANVITAIPETSVVNAVDPAPLAPPVAQ